MVYIHLGWFFSYICIILLVSQVIMYTSRHGVYIQTTGLDAGASLMVILIIQVTLYTMRHGVAV